MIPVRPPSGHWRRAATSPVRTYTAQRVCKLVSVPAGETAAVRAAPSCLVVGAQLAVAVQTIAAALLLPDAAVVAYAVGGCGAVHTDLHRQRIPHCYSATLLGLVMFLSLADAHTAVGWFAGLLLVVLAVLVLRLPQLHPTAATTVHLLAAATLVSVAVSSSSVYRAAAVAALAALSIRWLPQRVRRQIGGGDPLWLAGCAYAVVWATYGDHHWLDPLRWGGWWLTATGVGVLLTRLLLRRTPNHDPHQTPLAPGSYVGALFVMLAAWGTNTPLVWQ